MKILVHIVTRFIMLMEVYSEFHEIKPIFKRFLHIILRFLKRYSLGPNHDRKWLPCVTKQREKGVICAI